MAKPDQYVKNYGRPRSWHLVALSVIFHGVLVLFPMPQWWLNSDYSKLEPGESLEESGAIALTTLPIVAAPEPEVTPPVIPAPPAQIVEEPLPAELSPVEINEPAVDDEGEPEPEPPPDEPPPEAPPPEPDTTNGEPEAGIAFEFRDGFPHIGEAQAGCNNYGLGNCRTVDAQNLREVARSLRQDLEAQGYSLKDVTPEDSEEHANHKIFELSFPGAGEVKYLNIFGADDQLTGAFYIITPTLITRQNLKDLENNT